MRHIQQERSHTLTHTHTHTHTHSHKESRYCAVLRVNMVGHTHTSTHTQRRFFFSLFPCTTPHTLTHTHTHTHTHTSMRGPISPTYVRDMGPHIDVCVCVSV